jgi:hypothetical protein
MEMKFTLKKTDKNIIKQIKREPVKKDIMNNHSFFHLGMISRIENKGNCTSCGE